MALRSSWKGFIKLSLVSIPVKGYTAGVSGSDVALNQLHAECHNRIKYKKTCPEHGEVSNDEIVKGYEYAKGQYVVIDTDELDKLRTENDRSVQIDGFIDSSALDPIYYSGKSYYLAPDGAVGQKPYALLVRGMTEVNVHAIAQVVISGREQVVLLRPLENMLVMTPLHYMEQIKLAGAFQDEIVEQELTKEEMELTTLLVNASTIGELDFAQYKDKYTEKLTRLIQAKVDGEEVVQVPSLEEPKIINLMEALKKSVAEAQAVGTKKAAPGPKRAAPSARAKAKRKTTRKKTG